MAKPPCTTPIGLYRCSPASPKKVTLPFSASAPVKPIVAVIGGAGRLPADNACMNSRPVMPAAVCSAAIASSHGIVRVRELTRTIVSPRQLELGDRAFRDCFTLDATDRYGCDCA